MAIAYFDNAATTFPKPPAVLEACLQWAQAIGGSAGRGQYQTAAQSAKLVDETRGLLLELFHCTAASGKQVIFTPSATIALNMILQGLLAQQIHRVYLSPWEHNAVTRTVHYWAQQRHLEVSYLPILADGQWDLELIAEAFRQAPPDLVVVSQVSNVCGLIAPLEAIFRLAKRYGAKTVADLAQGAGLVELDLSSPDFDFAVFAGHKTLYGPLGSAGFIKSSNVALPPVLFGGTGIDSASLEMPELCPQRYEMGSLNCMALAGLHAALEWRRPLAQDLAEAEDKAHQQLLALLRSYDNLQIVGPQDRTGCVGVVSVIFPGFAPDNIGHLLDQQQIAVRTGLHCAPLAHRTLGTFPGGTVRFSVGGFTSANDFSRLQHALTYLADNSD